MAEGHLAYFVLDLVADLDLKAIEHALQSKDPRGERPYAPRMMVALLLYGYATGVMSSRKLERATYDDVPFRMLAAGEHPHFTSINEFRDRHRAALAGLFDQLLHECMSAGLVKLGHVAIDGTKMKANASKHKAMSFERMNQAEKRLTSEIDEYFELAKKIDAEEDERYGVGEQAHDLPAELRRREDRLAKIREVRAALKKETARARAAELVELADQLRVEAAQPTTSKKKQGEFTTFAAQRDQQAGELLEEHGDDEDDDPPPSPDDDLPRNVPPKRRDGTPKPRAQRNFTDAESRIMMRDGAFLQAYNGQIAVDESPHQIIVAAALSNQSPDVEYFRPMLERVVANCGAAPDRVTADSGYFSAENIRAAEHLGAEPFISVGKHKNDGELETRMVAYRPTPDRVAMAALLATERGRASYARRKATVEPVFGQIRICQNYQHVSFRGLAKNRLEWLLVCATHNLLKLWRAITRPAVALPAAA